MARAAAPLALLAGLAGLYLLTTSKAATVYPDGSTEFPVDGLPSSDQGSDEGYPADESAMPAAPEMTGADPVDSFLYVIRSSEHNALDVASGEAYRTVYGGARFSDLSDHPTATGEWMGQPLPAPMCIAAGIASGNCKSTAAGAYQFNLPTWRDFGSGLTFSPDDQDEAARRLLRSVGAADALYAGDLARAVQLAGKRWASLPGAAGGQGQRSMAFVLDKFNEAQGAA